MNEKLEDNKTKLTVRFTKNTKTNECWFEERLNNGEWVKIPETRYVCEGNSRNALKAVIESRRQFNLQIGITSGREEIYEY